MIFNDWNTFTDFFVDIFLGAFADSPLLVIYGGALVFLAFIFLPILVIHHWKTHWTIAARHHKYHEQTIQLLRSVIEEQCRRDDSFLIEMDKEKI